MPTYERLSAQDASFLYAETPHAHMHVGSLAVFKGSNLTPERLNPHIESRLHLVPRFRQKLVWVPLQQGRPIWADDPHFDVRFHLRYTGLPKPGGEAELLRLMGRIMSMPLDRERPLWEMWVVDLDEDHQVIMQKTHHCLIDGVSGVDMGTVVLDLSPDPPAGEPPPPFAPREAPSSLSLVKDALVERVTQPREMFRTARAATRTPRALLDQARDVAKGLVAFGKSSMELAPKTSLSGNIGGHRRFEVVRTTLADIKTIKNRHECTVNDVVLAIVSGGLGKLLRSRGDDTEGLVMKAMVPVSVRDPSQRMTYGNKVSMMAAELPVGEPDGVKRIAFVRERMHGLKESKQAVGADFWVKMSEYAPPTVLALAGRATALQRIVNLVVTNVPGPQFPLYMLGGEMTEVFPFVPILGKVSLAVGCVSYNGNLNFGLNGDWDVVPDLHVLRRGIQESLAELLD